MNFACRVDASATIGLGHLKRCVSLAQALTARGARVQFVCRDLGVPIVQDLARLGLHCTLLPAPSATTRAALQQDARPPAHAAWAEVDAATDARQTIDSLRILHPQGIDTVFIDHYSFDARWHDAVATGLGCRIAVIDDLADRPLHTDVLIDPNHAPSHAAKYAGRIAPDTPILGGPTYALLGPGYANAPRNPAHAQVRSIGIFMGGADAGNHSAMALQALRDRVEFQGEIEIVTTTANPHLRNLQALAARSPSTCISLDLPDLAAFFARHDLHIGAGGGATWERCCIGAPTLAMIVADNQRQVLEPLGSEGVLETVPDSRPTLETIARHAGRLIQSPTLRARLAERSRRWVDGLGAQRVAAYLSKGDLPED